MYGDTLRFDGLTALSKVEGRVRKVSPARKAPSPSPATAGKPLPPGEGKGERLRRSFSYRNINKVSDGAMSSSSECRSEPSIFEMASRVFDGWDDPETGLAVLKVATADRQVCPFVPAGATWHTLYHQCRSILEGGRKVLLIASRPAGLSPSHWPGGEVLMDLTSGEVTRPFPDRHQVVDVDDATNIAVLLTTDAGVKKTLLWDIKGQTVLAASALPGWHTAAAKLLSDGRRMIAGFYLGRWRRGKCHTRFYLVYPGGKAEQILDADGYFCNHVVGCPTDPDLYAYNRWPTPDRWVKTVNHIRSVDGSFETPLPLLPDTVRPGPVLDGQRDHYVWTPDGTRIASYLLPYWEDMRANHYTYRWWITVMNWRTGEDLCVPYPPERWGGHFQATWDSRYLVSGGGQRFDYLYAIDIEGLRSGWNERLLCRYPSSPLDQYGASCNRHPLVLPDMSGVLFTAGHGSPEHGVFLVEWPRKW